MSVINLTKDNFNSEVMESKMPVLIDFWASWCGPCKMVSPIVDEIGDELDNVKVCKVNVDDEPELAASFNIDSIPTLVVIKDKQMVNRSVGVKSKDEIKSML